MIAVSSFNPGPVAEWALLDEVQAMLDELEAHQLEVILVPARREANVGAMIRVAASKNATWYRDFCARFASSRRRKNCAFDTRIKRRNTLAVLRALLAGRQTSIYAPTLLAIARRRLGCSHVRTGGAA